MICNPHQRGSHVYEWWEENSNRHFGHSSNVYVSVSTIHTSKMGNYFQLNEVKTHSEYRFLLFYPNPYANIPTNTYFILWTGFTWNANKYLSLVRSLFFSLCLYRIQQKKKEKKDQKFIYYLCDNNAMDNFASNILYEWALSMPSSLSHHLEKGSHSIFLSHDIFLNMTNEPVSKWKFIELAQPFFRFH